MNAAGFLFRRSDSRIDSSVGYSGSADSFGPRDPQIGSEAEPEPKLTSVLRSK